MRLSEFSLPMSIMDTINRILPINEAEEMFRDLYESIKGNNTLVETFIDTHQTKPPVVNIEYFPVSTIFLIGQDKIELQYAAVPLEFIKSKNGDFIYSTGEKEIRFPPTYNSQMVVATTFHCSSLEESKELRGVVYMTFGDCDITEVKV